MEGVLSLQLEYVNVNAQLQHQGALCPNSPREQGWPARGLHLTMAMTILLFAQLQRRTSCSVRTFASLSGVKVSSVAAAFSRSSEVPFPLTLPAKPNPSTCPQTEFERISAQVWLLTLQDCDWFSGEEWLDGWRAGGRHLGIAQTLQPGFAYLHQSGLYTQNFGDKLDVLSLNVLDNHDLGLAGQEASTLWAGSARFSPWHKSPMRGL